ncbi:MAG: hypothetical protein ACI4SE_01630 [Lachnospiraceae bacterium]
MNTECNQVEQKKPVKERIHKISHVMEILVKIGRIAAIIGIVGISGLVLFLMLCGDMDLLVWMGDVIWHSPIHIPDMDFGNLNNWVSVGCLIGMVVELIFTVLFLKQVEEILAGLGVDDTPFHEKNVKHIRKLAVFYLVMSLIHFETTDGFENISVGISIMGIIGAGIFWLISLIFEYGCELQTEHDETL